MVWSILYLIDDLMTLNKRHAFMGLANGTPHNMQETCHAQHLPQLHLLVQPAPPYGSSNPSLVYHHSTVPPPPGQPLNGQPHPQPGPKIPPRKV
jgi:hypothetical protein